MAGAVRRSEGASGPAKREPAGWVIVGARPRLVAATVAPTDGGEAGVAGTVVTGAALR